ncbi:unnamed protein product [Durusdinium trenchii]|uniref:DOMON domain-containing protein n=1 Tax=Durusdinium trenchii TaxID=1381693 RepID=A0ABP0PNY3_9DINO
MERRVVADVARKKATRLTGVLSLMVVEWLAAKGLVASQAAAPEVLQLLPDLAWQQEHGLFALDPEELRVLGAGTSMHHWRDVALNETHTALEYITSELKTLLGASPVTLEHVRWAYLFCGRALLALSSTPGMLCLLWLPALAEAIASVPFATESYSQHVEALQGRVTFYWAVDESKQILRAGVAAQTAGWLGVGFNAFPEMTGADIVMMSVDADGNPLAVQDLHATGFSTPVADVTQDVVVNSQGRSNGISWFTFERNLTNCDTQGDYQFVRIGNEFTLLVAVGDSHTWQNHGASNREAIRMRLVETASPALPADVIQLPILAPDATVPTAPGSYVCSLHELPNDREYHLVRFKVKRGTAALVSDGGGSVLHHVDMFSCKHLPGAVNAIVACGVAMAACDEMLLSGGYSGHGENLPPDTGLSIGPSNKYVMINRHFYNAKGQAGIIDSGTGYDIWYTPTLRPNSMGRLSILQGHLDIPAGATGFTSIGYCPQKCTESMWPSSGITVTSVNFHMHSSGRRIRLQVIRAGQEMPDIARLDPFSDAGANVEVNYKLLPGDTLRLHCTYDNPSSAMLKWGEDRYDEMCVVNMLYYPKSELLACADFAKGQTEMFPPSQAFKTMCQTYCQPGQACGKGGVCESINFDDEGCMKCACPSTAILEMKWLGKGAVFVSL